MALKKSELGAWQWMHHDGLLFEKICVDEVTRLTISNKDIMLGSRLIAQERDAFSTSSTLCPHPWRETNERAQLAIELVLFGLKKFDGQRLVKMIQRNKLSSKNPTWQQQDQQQAELVKPLTRRSGTKVFD